MQPIKELIWKRAQVTGQIRLSMKSCFVKTFSQYIRLDNDQAPCLTLARSPQLSLSIAVLIKCRIFQSVVSLRR